MKTFFIALVSSCIVMPTLYTNAQNKQVYNALASKKLENIEQQIKSLDGSANAADKAYTGTLLMTKAGLVKGPAKKLKIFKQGRLLLEEVIEQNKDNGEYRFLRLMIQENAPGILGYNKEIEADAAIVQKTFGDLPKDVKSAIQDYSSESKTLKSLSLK